MSFPESIEPMAATLTQERFTGPQWTFERKFDGIRLLAFRVGANVRLQSRNRLPKNCPTIAEAIASLPLRDLILDGEVTLGKAGIGDWPPKVGSLRTPLLEFIEFRTRPRRASAPSGRAWASLHLDPPWSHVVSLQFARAIMRLPRADYWLRSVVPRTRLAAGPRARTAELPSGGDGLSENLARFFCPIPLRFCDIAGRHDDGVVTPRWRAGSARPKECGT